jgi:hypothetical protein
VVAGLDALAHVTVLDGMSDAGADHEERIGERFALNENLGTLLVFVDGAARCLDAFIDGLYAVFGLDAGYVGGGSGSRRPGNGPSLITNEGMLADSALIVELRTVSGVGVAHGWTPLEGPLRVTEAAHNEIISLDWTPAFERYRELVRRHSGRDMSADGSDFLEVSKVFPFGIAKLGAEMLVRDPLCLGPSGGLVCVGGVPEGAFVYLMRGDAESLFRAASSALAQAEANLPAGVRPTGGLLMDCNSRVRFLGDRFPEELALLCPPGVPMVGACSLGEIANNGKDFIEFYNKTTVVGLLGGA